MEIRFASGPLLDGHSDFSRWNFELAGAERFVTRICSCAAYMVSYVNQHSRVFQKITLIAGTSEAQKLLWLSLDTACEISWFLDLNSYSKVLRKNDNNNSMRSHMLSCRLAYTCASLNHRDKHLLMHCSTGRWSVDTSKVIYWYEQGDFVLISQYWF